MSNFRFTREFLIESHIEGREMLAQVERMMITDARAEKLEAFAQIARVMVEKQFPRFTNWQQLCCLPCTRSILPDMIEVESEMYAAISHTIAFVDADNPDVPSFYTTLKLIRANTRNTIEDYTRYELIASLIEQTVLSVESNHDDMLRSIESAKGSIRTISRLGGEGLRYLFDHDRETLI